MTTSSTKTETAQTLSTVEKEALAVTNDPVLKQMLDEERVEAQQVDTALLWTLLAYVKPHRWLAIVAVFFAFGEALLMTAPAYLIGFAIDQFSTGSPRTGWFAGGLHSLNQWASELWGAGFSNPRAFLIVWFGVLVLLCYFIRLLVSVATAYSMQKLGQLVVHVIRLQVYNHISAMDQTFFQSNPVGRLVNRTTFDVQAISELFSEVLAYGLRDLMFIFVLISVMLALDVPLALTLCAAFPFLIVTALFYRKAARPAMRTMSAVQSRMNAWMAENIAGMRENQLYCREDRRRAEFESLTEAHQSAITRVIQAWGLLRPIMMMVSVFATAGVLLLGYMRVEQSIVTIGVLLTFVQYTNRLWQPVRSLTEKFNLIQTSLTSGERVMDILREKSKLFTLPTADKELEVTRGEVEFDNVRFAYPSKPDKTILKGVSFHLKPGQKLALVGDTGSGKSTVINLLSRFYDVGEGDVLVDGRSVKEYTLQHLRSGIALVPQDVVIFAGTIRENITLGLEISDEKIWECVRAVCADSFIDRFPGKLDHILEESGRTLSTGERQLLSFARALVLNPPLLVLDEATANVDTQTERIIQSALERLTQGRSSIVIAHRLSTIRDSDQILVMRQGEVIEQGTHQELLARGGEYSRLHDLHLREDSRNAA
jgi:ABC-type multidrug transport system fused ATPase/permease subunit